MSANPYRSDSWVRQSPPRLVGFVSRANCGSLILWTLVAVTFIMMNQYLFKSMNQSFRAPPPPSWSELSKTNRHRPTNVRQQEDSGLDLSTSSKHTSFRDYEMNQVVDDQQDEDVPEISIKEQDRVDVDDNGTTPDSTPMTTSTANQEEEDDDTTMSSTDQDGNVSTTKEQGSTLKVGDDDGIMADDDILNLTNGTMDDDILNRTHDDFYTQDDDLGRKFNKQQTDLLPHSIADYKDEDQLQHLGKDDNNRIENKVNSSSKEQNSKSMNTLEYEDLTVQDDDDDDRNDLTVQDDDDDDDDDDRNGSIVKGDDWYYGIQDDKVNRP